MKATAIVPVKRFGAAKQRLAWALDDGARGALVRAMLDDTLEALAGASSLERVLVVSGERGIVAVCERHGVDRLDDPADAGHSEAAGIGVQAAIAAGAGCVALLPGDCPLLDPAELDGAIEALPDNGAVAVIPDRHGTGTNGLILAPPDAIRPSFGPGSCERHLQLAAATGVHASVAGLPSLGLDLDTRDDLAALVVTLAASPARAPRTAAALDAIDPVPAPAASR